jgi:hypothetical protein
MFRRPVLLLAALVAVAAMACSSNEPNNTTPAPGTSAGTTPKVGTTLEETGDLAAEAKTAVTEFFEKKAVNNYDDARKRSSGSAKFTIDWAADVNAIKAVEKTPFALPPVAAPNVRVQIDAVEKQGDLFAATGFVELGSRPSGVASTTTTSTTTVPGASPAPTTYFVVDLIFAKGTDGGLTVDDYRLDDTPYPVSQLFTDFAGKKSGSTGGTTGSSGTTAGPAVDVTLRLGHRDLDGSVQYDLKYEGDDGTKMTKAAFVAKPAGTSTTAKGAGEVDATVYADPISGGEAGALVVRPGAFPGEPGVLRLTFEDAQKKTTVVEVPVGEWPELTPRPVNQVRDRITASSTTTSSTSSTTSTTGVPSTVTVTVPGPTVTVTVPGSSTTKPSTPTTSSTSTTTAP